MWDGDKGSLTYAYEEPSWPDLLTAVNGQKIAYEGQRYHSASNTVSGTVISGNPISYFNGDTRWNFTWQNGRQLATATSTQGDTDTVIAYAYDLNGYRTEKTVTTKTYEKVPVHNYVITVVAPTCTEDGYTLHACVCGYSYRTDETAALGHDYVRNTSNTAISYTCTRCGDTYTEHTHSYTTTVVAPTCVDDGYTLHECACGHNYRDAEENALGHSFVQISQNGTTATFRCTRCGYMYTSESIPVPTDPKPPISSYSQEEDDHTVISTTSCGSMRVLRSTVTEEHSYIYAGGRLLRETITTTAADGTVTTKILDFAYDAQGTPYSLTYTNGTASPTTYYYITNLQGDVMQLIDSTGETKATYSYDPYGQVLWANGAMAEINPLQYRGYYYDSDSNLYYLQSRYYDANVCRFINADTYTNTGNGFIGYNMFAYCNNNPVVYLDEHGTFLGTLIGAVVGAAFGALEAAIKGEDVLAGAASGAVSGAITGLAADVIAVTGGTAAVVIGVSAFASGAGSFAGSAVGAAISGEKFDFAEATKDALWSAATGALFGYMGGPVASQLDKVAQKGIGKVVGNTFCKNAAKKAATSAGEEILSSTVSAVARVTIKAYVRMFKSLLN